MKEVDKKKRGRKAKPSHLKKSHCINLYVTAAEFKQIEDSVDNKSKWLRRIAFKDLGIKNKI